MSTMQIIFLGVGGLIILSSLDVSSLKDYLFNPTAKPKPIVIPNVPSVPIVPVNKGDELVNIVRLWQSLKDECEENKLSEAVEKLDEIFPMLIKVDDK